MELGAGTFFLGDGKDAPRKTAWMRRGLKLAGVKEGSEWRTVIRGGGEVLDPGVGGPLESGPIRVKLEGDDHAVIIEDIWFRDWPPGRRAVPSRPRRETRRCRRRSMAAA